MKQAACVAGALSAGAWPAQSAMAQVRHYAPARIVDEFRRPLKTRHLKVGEPWLFNYPYASSPVFLLALDSVPAAADLVTETRRRYTAPSGVGPRRNVVAFSAICAHKLMYPTPQISFIGVRRGQGGEPAHVIHCCGDQSRYDPAHGARVIGGPAPQPLAAVLLDWDARSDELSATGVVGGEMFQAFFEKYAFRLEMEMGRRARDLAGPTAVAKPAAAYSRQWQSCRV